MPSKDASAEPQCAETAASEAGLTYVNDGEPGYSRIRSGTGFAYRDAQGRTVKDKKVLKRIKSLVIPPAWSDVWICASPNGHLQATGRDARGRKVYKYHPDFRAHREDAKFGRILVFARALPAIRKKVDGHLRKKGLPRDKVLAATVHLLETTLIRVGNQDYARQNKSYGLTTLRDRHVSIEGAELRFQFKGKSGKEWNLALRDRRIAKVVKACQDIPGQHLLQYFADDGSRASVTSGDVNAYLREITNEDFTAKDFRTWAGTVLAALALQELESFDSEAGAKRNVRGAIEKVAALLGNTPTICRTCYVHPEILDSYMSGELLLDIKDEAETRLRKGLKGLKPEEVAVLTLLRARLERDLGGKGAKKAA